MEFEDKNLKAAIQKASKTLNIPADALQYEVISYGSTGIFGLVGVKKAKIRVTAPTSHKEEVKGRPPRKEAPKKEIKEEKGVTENPPEPAASYDENGEEAYTIDPEAVALGKEVLQKIVDEITEEASISVVEEDGTVIFRVEGGKSSVLIGKRGQTLEAIQYLVDRIVNKQSENRLRLQIDVAGYLEGKKTSLEQRALTLAEKAKSTGKPVTVGEMNVYDRKIVHMCLKNDSEVKTQSMGSGFYRKLTIFPKKANQNKKRRS